MSEKVLVTYASRQGSTEEVARAIARNFAASGIPVEICSMEEVHELDNYNTIIAGSPIQAQKWLPEAMQFLDRYKTELKQKKVAIFTLCMTLAMPAGEKYREGVLSWLNPVRVLANPVDEGLFAGALDIVKINKFSDRLKFRLSVLMGVWKEGDHRDWNVIQEWTEGLKRKLSQYL